MGFWVGAADLLGESGSVLGRRRAASGCFGEDSRKKESGPGMPQPTKAIISNEQKSGIRKGSNRASTGKVGALLLSVYIV